MSKDVKPLEVYSCDLLVDGKQVAFVVSDHDKNIIIYNYDPEGKIENVIHFCNLFCAAHYELMDGCSARSANALEVLSLPGKKVHEEIKIASKDGLCFKLHLYFGL